MSVFYSFFCGKNLNRYIVPNCCFSFREKYLQMQNYKNWYILLIFRDLLHYDAKFLCQMFDVSIGMLCKFCMLIVLID